LKKLKNVGHTLVFLKYWLFLPATDKNMNHTSLLIIALFILIAISG